MTKLSKWRLTLVYIRLVSILDHCSRIFAIWRQTILDVTMLWKAREWRYYYGGLELDFTWFGVFDHFVEPFIQLFNADFKKVSRSSFNDECLLNFSLCGYPPFYSRRGMAMSPGMRDHIVKGEYRFPDREWQRISREAKELVQRLLVVDPKKRATIDNIMKDPWILSHRKLPDVPLGSADILHSEKPNWEEMRVSYDGKLFLAFLGNILTSGLKWKIL